MSAALTAQPGLHSTAMAVSMKAKVKGKDKKRKRKEKNTMAGRACATTGVLLQYEVMVLSFPLYICRP